MQALATLARRCDEHFVHIRPIAEKSEWESDDICLLTSSSAITNAGDIATVIIMQQQYLQLALQRGSMLSEPCNVIFCRVTKPEIYAIKIILINH